MIHMPVDVLQPLMCRVGLSRILSPWGRRTHPTNL